MVPNTLNPALKGIDYNALPSMFKDCMAHDGVNLMREDILAHSCISRILDVAEAETEPRTGVEIQLENIVGPDGVKKDAMQAVGLEDISASITEKMIRIADQLNPFLPLACQQVLERAISARKLQSALRAPLSQDDDTTDDERNRTETQETSSLPANQSQEPCSPPLTWSRIPTNQKTPVRRQNTMPEDLLSPFDSSSRRQQGALHEMLSSHFTYRRGISETTRTTSSY
jgi:hypothetical protein